MSKLVMSKFFHLSKTKYCKANDLDPEDPRCARLVLSGSFHKVDKNSKGNFFKEKTSKISSKGVLIVLFQSTT